MQCADPATHTDTLAVVYSIYRGVCWEKKKTTKTGELVIRLQMEQAGGPFGC